MMNALKLRARAFRNDTTGSMAVETVLIFPMLLWFYLSTFTYFDGYRVQATNIKAAYTVGDAISRELDGVDATYLQTMHTLMSYLNTSAHNTRLRVTVLTRNKKNGKLVRIWSCTYGNGASGFVPHNNKRLRKLDDKIPPSPKPDQLVLVETFVDYAPPFSAQLFDNEPPPDGMLRTSNPEGIMIGLQPTTFSNIVVTRPRSVNQVKLKNNAC